MNRFRNSAKWREIAVGLATAGAVALGLVAVGLSEVSWAPFFVVAVAGSSGRSCLDPRGARL